MDQDDSFPKKVAQEGMVIPANCGFVLPGPDLALALSINLYPSEWEAGV